ncbi:magnesium/cobalt transporter CorA [Inquilinus sp. CAU 1745]|uniref:magnesium/cobalt transporter CorA n=1 Tax=Inquilinus sp. CAU 1745 TaxID=3140369 RepID=UPI00325AC650
MIKAYSRRDGRVVDRDLSPGDEAPADAIWIDALHPSEEERAYLSDILSIDLPTRADMEEIEASSRIYVEDGISFMTAPIVAKADSGRPELGAMTFVLTPRLLVTLRFVDPKSIPIFVQRLQRQPDLCDNAHETLVSLLETVVDRCADVVELIAKRLESLSERIFRADAASPRRHPEAELHDVMRVIGRSGELMGKMRDSLAGLERIAAYLSSTETVQGMKDVRVRLKTVQRDLRSLSEHSNFQSQRISFLLDATLGVINIEQTAIIKIFSVAAVAFLPPTLIASIYGMNFDLMPELSWPFGYPMALALMLASAVLPLWFFRRRGWL